MVTTEIPVSLQLPQGRAPRSAGVHVSSIIRCIAMEAGILSIETQEDLSLIEVTSQGEWWDRLDDVAKARISMGLAWEEFYIPTLEGVVDHPGEMEVQGIFMTHDGESLDVLYTERGPRQTLCVHEVKCTYKSLNTVVEENGNISETQWMWLSQVKAYCHGLKTLTAYLHVYFVCGDYSWPQRPVPKCWRLDFTQQEIDDNWELLRSYRDARLPLEN